MGSDQHYSLRWNDYTVKIVTAFQHLRDEEDFVDVTVACDGHSYAAHKMVLSACSPYFRTLLRANPCQHPIVILKDVGHTEMERLLEFMYNGEVNIAQDQLGAFLKTAENLKIRGLAGSSDESDQNHTKDLSHSFSSTYGGGQSGRSSPSAGYAPSQGSKDDEIIQDGQGSHARPDSPPSKRRKRSNMAALGQTDVNTSSQSADGVTEESGQSDIVSAGQLGSEDDQRTDRREMKSEPGDSMTDIYSESSDLSIDPQQVPHGDGLDPRQSVMYPLAIPGPSGSAGATDTVPAGSHEPGDVSALLAIANAVQATAPSDRPIKCPLCQSIIKQARNLRRHVFKRHLPAAKRGEITEADVKSILEKKLKAITVTPLTEEELRQVQQRTRKKGMKSPRKKKGLAALPSDVNSSSINEHEITIRKLPQKKKDKPGASGSEGANKDANREDILQEALAARDKDAGPQDEVMDLATTQLPPISVVVSHGTGAVQVAQPMSLTVTQTATGVHARIPAEAAALQAGVRLQSDSPLPLHRDLPTMPMPFEPQVTISEGMVTYHTTSPSQVIPQSSSPSPSASGYAPSPYWSTPAVPGLPTGSFQPHQSVFSPAHSEYFTAGVAHMARPSTLERMQQHRRKPYQ
ncbi:uncharacterized protein LOC143018520 isoform X9 [Oratosquilla oratoria]|uniref:uncharacterized protein LOC143018520 isoform X9 n=1 Tax=Oratosquilla oratoria TaxID=337810 RepID=UPI003F75FFD2